MIIKIYKIQNFTKEKYVDINLIHGKYRGISLREKKNILKHSQIGNYQIKKVFSYGSNTETTRIVLSKTSNLRKTRTHDS